MRFSLLALVISCLTFSVSFQAISAVILQYHHVSDSTPPSTSISPAQFRVHMQYLKDNHFNVVPLSEVIDAIKSKNPLKDKTVAITFDDAYIDILTQGKPILDEYNFPFTIFVNPAIIERSSHKKSPKNLTWQQLKVLADSGVIIANHGFEHDSVARITSNHSESISEAKWLEKQGELLLKSEAIIKEKTGQSWQYFAYPYGEYTPAIQHWVKQHDFVAFSQQSGAAGINSDLTSIPRFPASQPYDQISALRDKLNSLPLNIELYDENAETVFTYKENKSVTFNVLEDDFNPSQLNCYISGLGKQKIHWLDDTSFTINFKKSLPIGRVRCNCTAPSISKPGRYYWYSKPWFILKADGSWYHL